MEGEGFKFWEQGRRELWVGLGMEVGAGLGLGFGRLGDAGPEG